MPGKIIKLNGIYKYLGDLLGTNFWFIPAHNGISQSLPLCPRKRSCKSNRFLKQRKICRDNEIAGINKCNNPKLKINRFDCGLSELILPLFDNRDLIGIVLTDKIRISNNRLNNDRSQFLPSLNLSQISSLSSLINSSRAQFKEIAFLYQNAVPNKKDKVLIQRARIFIEKNYHRPRLPLRELAKEIYTSYFYLCRLFKKELNLTFVQYLTLVRLRAALKLLQNLNLTVGQVAYAVGFSEVQYFDRVFKKNLRCRPKDYRASSIAKREKIREQISSLMQWSPSDYTS